MRPDHYDDPAFAARYVKGPEQFAPGYKVMQRMAAQLIAERAGQDAEVLVLGAGGGLEIAAFAELQPGWRFTGVDPSAEMLAQAKARAPADRSHWVEGYIQNAPEGPFDAATCLLTLHFVPDDGGKLETLKAIRARLRPGAPFVLAHLCIDKSAPDFDARRDRYARFALDSGAEPDDVADTRERLKTIIDSVPQARDEALLAEAGFTDTELFWAGHSWRGWIASA
jgi:tRNA (cmo5U34)-methyltransferase